MKAIQLQTQAITDRKGIISQRAEPTAQMTDLSYMEKIGKGVSPKNWNWALINENFLSLG